MITVSSGNYPRIKKIFGATVTIGGTEYDIKEMGWENMAEGPGGDALPCFIVDMTSTLEIKPGFRKEPKKQAAGKKESAFAPAVKLLGLPKEEAREVIAALEGSKKKVDYYMFNFRVREKIFFRLIEYRAAREDDGKEKEIFIKNILDGRYDHLSEAQNKKVIFAFAGSTDPAALISFVTERIFAVANAVRFSVYDVPGPEDFGKPGAFITWAGIPKDDLKKMYQEEIRALMPKPKEAGKKPARKKNIPGGKEKEK
jgi:hypothetical protein